MRVDAAKPRCWICSGFFISRSQGSMRKERRSVERAFTWISNSLPSRERMCSKSWTCVLRSASFETSIYCMNWKLTSKTILISSAPTSKSLSKFLPPSKISIPKAITSLYNPCLLCSLLNRQLGFLAFGLRSPSNNKAFCTLINIMYLCFKPQTICCAYHEDVFPGV